MNTDYEEASEHAQFELLIQGLVDNEYGSCDNFISPDIISGLRVNLETLKASGKMALAGFGNKQDFQKDKTTRGDQINWINTGSSDLFEMNYLRKVERFILYLNTTCFTSLKSLESHYANYGISEFYVRHKDQFENEKGRQYSIVLYLNLDWKIEDGGMLSLYPKGKKQIDISPFGGRMVFFHSSQMEHEVKASFTRDRSSIAGWLKN